MRHLLYRFALGDLILFAAVASIGTVSDIEYSAFFWPGCAGCIL